MDYTPLLYAAGAGGLGGLLYSVKNNLLNKANEAAAGSHVLYGVGAAILAVLFMGLAYPSGLDVSMVPALGVGYIGTEYVPYVIDAITTGTTTPPKPPATP